MWSKIGFFYLILFSLLAGFASPTSISDDAFKSHGSTGRTLLQAKTACSVDFEHQNYTIITSQCKGPNFLPSPCCAAFKQFACPFAEQISDMRSNCASTMFSYINVYGEYPPGLFSSLCTEGKQGLDCDSAKTNGVPFKHTLSPMVVVTSWFFILLFKLF